jgi:hypothetical protein
MSTELLHLSDAQLERLADLIADRVRPQASNGQLVDTRTLAALLGVTESWVRAHADRLGAIRLGERGARLRFDVDRARAALDVPPPTPTVPAPRRKRRQAVGSILKVRA